MIKKSSLLIAFLYCISISMAQNVGVKTSTPQATLDVNGKLKVADDTDAPVAGMIRWNTATGDFEGYDGTKWVTLTNKSGAVGGWGNNYDTESLKKNSGEFTSGDAFGASISVDGDYAIIGAQSKTVTGLSSAGKAYVFVRSGTDWVRQAILTASDPAISDFFGCSVSINGNYAIVGSKQKTAGGGAASQAGAAYIFIRSGTTWTQQAKLLASDFASSDQFGSSVSISGDYVVVGAPGKTVGANTSQGKAYIFIRSGTSWTEQTILTASDGLALDYFSRSVSISGDYIVVGADGKDLPGNAGQGGAYIFFRSGATWTEQAIIIASDPAGLDGFGYSTSISGDYAIVGAWAKTIGQNAQQGKAYIFNRNGTTWTQQAELTASNGTAGDNFGWVVSISGNYAIVGANQKKIGVNDFQGAAFIYVRNDTQWQQQSILVASDGVVNDRFGNGIAISANTAIAGCPVKSVVYFYQRN